MKVFVSIAPIIGVVVLAAYFVYLRVACYLRSLKNSDGKQRVTYHSGLRIYLFADSVSKRERILWNCLLAAEGLLILVSIIVPRVTGGDYLIEGMSNGSTAIITEDTFKVSYEQAKREYSDSITLSQEELDNLSVACSAKQGKVYLTMRQDKAEKKVEITNTNAKLDMTEFAEGSVSFTLSNEEARGVDFALIW